MERIAQFDIVSFKQYEKDYLACLGTKEGAYEAYQNIVLPKRATAGSAGYDILTPFPFHLNPGMGKKIPTGLRVKMEEGWTFMIFPKSGLGVKNRLQLDNTVGIIDADYYNSENEGHIIVPIRNNFTTEGMRYIDLVTGKAFVQGIFVPFGITNNDIASGVRNGGFGSTEV